MLPAANAMVGTMVRSIRIASNVASHLRDFWILINISSFLFPFLGSAISVPPPAEESLLPAGRAAGFDSRHCFPSFAIVFSAHDIRFYIVNYTPSNAVNQWFFRKLSVFLLISYVRHVEKSFLSPLSAVWPLVDLQQPAHPPRHIYLITILHMRINICCSGNIRMAQPFLNLPQWKTFFEQQGCRRMPLRYNNDKRKKPLFSRGLSVCRHLFNSFSKLKYDEKIIK